MKTKRKNLILSAIFAFLLFGVTDHANAASDPYEAVFRCTVDETFKDQERASQTLQVQSSSQVHPIPLLLEHTHSRFLGLRLWTSENFGETIHGDVWLGNGQKAWRYL